MSRILITSALPYINGIKHLGNLAGSMLPADVFARFKRAQGHETLYICATDEHGTPAELAAAAAGQDVQTYCDEQHEIQKAAGARPSASATTGSAARPSAPNRRLTQHFAKVLEENGLIEERVDRMIYSIDDARFLPDRYVEGTCPHCGHVGARGDQCDNCGRAAGPDRPDRPLFVGLRLDQSRGPRHPPPLSAADQDWPTASAPGSSPSRDWQTLAQLDRPQTPRRGPDRPRHHPRPEMGRAGRRTRRRPAPGHGGQGLLRLVRRPHRIHRRDRGVGRSERPRPGATGGAPTRARTTSATSSSWARTTSPSTPSASPRPCWARASRGRRSTR